MEVYTVKLSNSELIQLRVALAVVNNVILQSMETANAAGDKDRVLNLEQSRIKNDLCHIALDNAKLTEEVDNG